MIRSIMKDTIFLAQRSEPATVTDKQTITDLKDTLQANSKTCVGMAANMIGVKKRIIVVDLGIMPMILINPEIVQKSGSYEAEEGCLSLVGVRRTTRFREITVEYLDEHFQKQRQKFSGFIAQNIQHQCDHLEGKII
ncbi:MAG: peptide deformylase [Lachnospiraceae bacterium]|nr:peptide deformylase [Lachnospiraceae bacterium]